ncbi:hypothetical protein [Deinococcus ruber]|uniref:hypothetical protein n=1 Tax=Deinococcus ruber TaxID=1848197 RepID=UPI001E2CE354|nr:hypothetical protein [Deinococcus ruber]
MRSVSFFPRVIGPALLGLSVLLAGCSPRQDTFKPLIVITSPDGGSASAARSFLVKGYVVDDQGVRSLEVQKVAVKLDTPGEKIQPFSFRTLIQGQKADYVIKATDTSGNVAVLTLPVRVDTVKPSVKVTKLERDGQTLRVTGVATDDQKVAQVIVDGSRLNITPGTRVEFYAETTGQFAEIEVRDAAGNTFKTKAR